MFIFDWVGSKIFDAFIDWVLSLVMDLIVTLSAMCSGVQASILHNTYILAILKLFELLGFALFLIGLVIAISETALEYQKGKGNFIDTFTNCIKGLLAALLFVKVPVVLFEFSLSMSASFNSAITKVNTMTRVNQLAHSLQENPFITIDGGQRIMLSGFMLIIIVGAIGYVSFKTFFASMKRAGVLVIQIVIGALHMVSVPRGYCDSFYGWCKKIIGICMELFLMNGMLIIGLVLFQDNPVIGFGVLMASGEVTRLLEQYGVDTNMRTNVSSLGFMGMSLIRNFK